MPVLLGIFPLSPLPNHLTQVGGGSDANDLHFRLYGLTCLLCACCGGKGWAVVISLPNYELRLAARYVSFRLMFEYPFPCS